MTRKIEYDTSKTGLRAVLKEWEEKALRVVWENPEGVNSRAVWQKVGLVLEGETISRASVINFLEDMREMGILKGVERTGKGGHHWVYSPAMNEQEFKKYIATTLLESLVRDFPEESKSALKRA